MCKDDFVQILTLHEIPHQKLCELIFQPVGVGVGKNEFAVQIWTFHIVSNKNKKDQ